MGPLVWALLGLKGCLVWALGLSGPPWSEREIERERQRERERKRDDDNDDEPAKGWDGMEKSSPESFVCHTAYLPYIRRVGQ
jgi:hypothetical protein